MSKIVASIEAGKAKAKVTWMKTKRAKKNSIVRLILNGLLLFFCTALSSLCTIHTQIMKYTQYRRTSIGMKAIEMTKTKVNLNFAKHPLDGSIKQLVGSMLNLWLLVDPLEPHTWHHSYSQYLHILIFLLLYFYSFLNDLLQKGHSMKLPMRLSSVWIDI